MKTNSNRLFGFFILMMAVFSFSCASKGTVTSTVSSEHLTVEQTTAGVNIVLKKAAEDNFDSVKVFDDAGSSANVSVNGSEVSFPWPFAEYNKAYTITAEFTGANTSFQESVSFTVENDVAPAISYTDDYLNSKLSLNAVGNERLLKFYTTPEKLESAYGKSKVSSSVLNLNVFSGSRFKDPENAVLVADWNIDLAKKDVFKTVSDGYDLIQNATRFGVTPEQLNNALKSNETYYASASVSFSLDGNYPEGIEFSTKPIFTNDTVYTPLADDEIPQVTLDEK